MNTAGKPPTADRRRRPWLLLFSLSLIVAGLIAVIILFSFIILWPPRFQVDSISISFDDNNVSKWIISFSVSNPNPVTLRYRKIEVSVAGRRPVSSTAAMINPPFKHRFRGRSSRNATVYVALPSPRPQLIINGAEFGIRFQTEYASPTGRTATVVVACGNKDVRFATSNAEVAIIGGPVHCKVVSRLKGS